MKNKWWQKRTISFCILAAALILMAAGVYRGEMAVVLNKAVHICMECIGLG